MTDTLQESASGAQEPKAPPVPEVSGVSEGQRPSAEAVEPQGLEAVRGVIKAELETFRRELQSEKDRRLAQAEKTYGRLSDLEPILSRFEQILAENKGDVQAAKRQLKQEERDQKIDELLATGSRAPDHGGSGAGDEALKKRMEKRAGDILEEAGIAPDDPEVTTLAGEAVTSEDQYYHKLNRLVARRLKQASVGAGATVTEPGKTPGPAKEERERLTAELEEIRSGKRGSAMSPENKQRRKEIREKLASL